MKTTIELNEDEKRRIWEVAQALFEFRDSDVRTLTAFLGDVKYAYITNFYFPKAPKKDE